jgi:hypothetical protein
MTSLHQRAAAKRTKRRQELINVVHKGLEMSGAALEELRDDEHWKDSGHTTFSNFCRETFSISKTKLYTILKGMEVVAALPKNLQPLVTSDAQIIALSKLPENKRADAVSKAEQNGGTTAENITLHGTNIAAKSNVTDPVALSRVRNSPVSESQRVTHEKSKTPIFKKDKVVVFDNVGTPVPEDALPYWNRRQEVQDVLTQISRMRAMIKSARDSEDCLWAKHGQDGYEYLSRAYSYLSDALPHAVCLQCQGSYTLQPDGCSVCGNTGFISEYRFDHYLPKEMPEIRLKSNEALALTHPESPLNQKQEATGVC